MERLEKCELLKSKGYTYNPNTGQIFNNENKELTATNIHGYKYIKIQRRYNLLSHHFAYFMTYGNVDFEMLDHINRDRSDNRISNLRSVTNQKNCNNQYGKGYRKVGNKWKSYIKIDYKQKHLGTFNTEEEAREAYIKAKVKLLP